MNINVDIPGLKDVVIEKLEQVEVRVVLHVSMPKQSDACSSCSEKTMKVHDYCIQKIKHLKWFEGLTVLFYERRSPKLEMACSEIHHTPTFDLKLEFFNCWGGCLFNFYQSERNST